MNTIGIVRTKGPLSTLQVHTRGHYDFVNITDRVAEAVRQSSLKDGIVHCFVTGTTAGLTIMEDEDGIKADLKRLWERWAPEDADYEHHKKWGDHNGAAHMKSALLGTSVSVPVRGGKLQLGQWQSIVLIDFDERPRTREITATLLHTAGT